VREEEEDEDADQPKEELQGSSAKPVRWERTRRKQTRATPKEVGRRWRKEKGEVVVVVVSIEDFSMGKGR
jgi:hypothetical protein